MAFVDDDSKGGTAEVTVQATAAAMAKKFDL
jgi:hypothetical protein